MLSLQIKLSDVSNQHEPFLLQVYTSTRMEELSVTDWSDGRKAEFCRMQYDAQTAHYRTYYPKASFQIVEFQGFNVGRLYVDRWTREIRIMDIAFLPEQRGKGIGTFLLHELQAEARVSGKFLSIHVEKFNRALLLYGRLGFHVAEEKEVYLLLHWVP